MIKNIRIYHISDELRDCAQSLIEQDFAIEFIGPSKSAIEFNFIADCKMSMEEIDIVVLKKTTDSTGAFKSKHVIIPDTEFVRLDILW